MTMIIDEKGLIQPTGNPTLWRYMDFASFYSVLLNKSFFFKRLDKYSDAFEGTLHEITKQLLYENRRNFPLTTEDEAKDWTKKLLQNIESYTAFTLSNSWTINDYEDYSMWKIYLNGSNEGVAIKTNLEKFLSSPVEQPDTKVYAGQVNYEAINKDDLNVYSVSTNKREYYSYEKEYRALLFRQFNLINSKDHIKAPKYEVGKSVKFNLECLIEEIYISPFSGSWFEEVVKSAVKEHLSFLPIKKVIKSKIIEN